MNLCEIGLFHIVWGISKGTRDNYHEIWWKKCFVQNIWISGDTGGMYMVHRTFFVYYSKNWKHTRAWPIIKSNSTSFWFNFFFSRMNNKNWSKKEALGGAGTINVPAPISLWSKYSSSNWFHRNTHNSRHFLI